MARGGSRKADQPQEFAPDARPMKIQLPTATNAPEVQHHATQSNPGEIKFHERGVGGWGFERDRSRTSSSLRCAFFQGLNRFFGRGIAFGRRIVHAIIETAQGGLDGDQLVGGDALG